MRGTSVKSWIFSWLAGMAAGSDYEVLPSIQPVLEISADWPLQLQHYAGDVAAMAVGYSVVLPGGSVGPAGRHRLWTELYIQQSGGTAWAVNSKVLLTLSNGTIALDLTYCPNLNGWPVGAPLALVGGPSTVYITSGNLANHKSVYVPDICSLTLGFTGNTGGENVSIRGRYIDVPISQPLPKFLF